MNIHFIAIGGSAMHNLAIALSRKGVQVTGSDDEVFEPSRSRLALQGILPAEIGWFPEKITSNTEAVILGMHAREDNPELLRAKELNIPIFSYPEYLYEQSKNKQRIVIGGSHGKTTITSMLLHVVQAMGIEVDYMVGAQLEGYDCMVRLSDTAKYMILEGDEYLSSPIDRRPKFHLYQPNAAIISGIAWDHVNVFPTWENYVEQFRLFCDCIQEGGRLIANQEDETVKLLGAENDQRLEVIPYQTPDYQVTEFGTIVHWENESYELKIFGAHNLQNAVGAMRLAEVMGISNAEFWNALATFTGAGKRLQKVAESKDFVLFKDFAHSPSKLKATTTAVKEQYRDRKVVACMELHTFSSLQKSFLPQYNGAMNAADKALVYFSPKVVAHKRLPELSIHDVQEGFGGNVTVVTTTQEVLDFVHQEVKGSSALVMMSSGNFDGIDYDELGQSFLK